MNFLQTLFKPKSPLFSEIEPYNKGWLDVGDGHKIYYEESGNPNGVPVVGCHGGPGAASKPKHRRLFNPLKYRIILFDQRGCGQSMFEDQFTANTTQHLVADMAALRAHLGIDAWHIFGGSWGSALALTYAQTWPKSVKSLVIHGVFLATKGELAWLYEQNGAERFFLDVFVGYKAHLPAAEQKNILASYIKQILTPPSAARKAAALAYSSWELNLLGIQPNRAEIAEILAPDGFDDSHTLMSLHYCQQAHFLTEGQILRDMDKIKHLPLSIVQGRYDMVCPPASAWAVHKAMPHSSLVFAPMAGHSSSDVGMAEALVEATERHAAL